MTPTNERLFTTWVTSLDQVDHAVTDEEFAARLIEGRGVFVAVCGMSFLPGPMEGVPGPPCGSCVDVVQNAAEALRKSQEAMNAPHESPETGRSRRGWLSRLLGCHELPAGAGSAHVFLDLSASAGVHREVRG